MLEKRQGFTLIEMLGAILILGLLFLLVIPSIISQIIKTTDDIDEATKKMIFSSSEAYIAKNNNDYPKTKGDVYCIPIQTLINSKELIEELVDSKTGKKINPLKMIKINIENEANITYKIVNECEEIINDPSGANHPFLLEGMTPIKWDDNNNEIVFDKDTDDNSWFVDWYNYEQKKWANAKTDDGSYWVWIPRYAYKIINGYHEDTDDGEIDVKFLQGITNLSLDDTSIETEGYNIESKNTGDNYFLHPAFKFGDDDILGFWVAKFSPSNNNDNVKIVPGATIWTSISVSEAFSKCLDMKTKIDIYGWSSNEVDTHMMKNIEWGAVAYLSKSQYGADGKVWHNSYNDYQTGCSSENDNATSSGTCIEYHTKNGVKASTTHTIYGVYDMRGGAWEYVMGNLLVDNNRTNASAGFQGDELKDIGRKYIDEYTNYESNIYGDAVYETSGKGTDINAWDGAYSNFVTGSGPLGPWFARGGSCSSSSSGVFAFGIGDGESHDYHTFRPVALYSAVNE